MSGLVGGQLSGEGWQKRQEESDALLSKERADRDARQAQIISANAARRAQFPENRAALAPPPDMAGLRDRLYLMHEAAQAARRQLGLATEAGMRATEHCAVMVGKLEEIDRVERHYAGTLASVIRAGSPVDVPPDVIEARSRRPGVERDAQAADRAASELASDIDKAQASAAAAAAAVRAAAMPVMAAEARAIADKIVEHERAAGELFRRIEPLGTMWFGAADGNPGGPVPLDDVARSVFTHKPRLAGADHVPPMLLASRNAEAIDRWRTLFAALLTNADASLAEAAAEE